MNLPLAHKELRAPCQTSESSFAQPITRESGALRGKFLERRGKDKGSGDSVGEGGLLVGRVEGQRRGQRVPFGDAGLVHFPSYADRKFPAALPSRPGLDGKACPRERGSQLRGSGDDGMPGRRRDSPSRTPPQPPPRSPTAASRLATLQPVARHAIAEAGWRRSRSRRQGGREWGVAWGQQRARGQDLRHR